MWNNLFCHSDLCSLTWLKTTWQPSSCLSGVTGATLLPGSLTLKIPSTSKDTLHYSLNRLSGEPNYPWTLPPTTTYVDYRRYQPYLREMSRTSEAVMGSRYDFYLDRNSLKKNQQSSAQKGCAINLS